MCLSRNKPRFYNYKKIWAPKIKNIGEICRSVCSDPSKLQPGKLKQLRTKSRRKGASTFQKAAVQEKKTHFINDNETDTIQFRRFNERVQQTVCLKTMCPACCSKTERCNSTFSIVATYMDTSFLRLIGGIRPKQ